MTAPERLEKWKRLADAAPPAPWHVVGVSFHPGEEHKPLPPGVFEVQGERGERADKVLDFVASAREAVPALIAEVEALRQALREVEWSRPGGFEGCLDLCPVCRRRKDDGHAPDCRLAALLEPR